MFPGCLCSSKTDEPSREKKEKEKGGEWIGRRRRPGRRETGRGVSLSGGPRPKRFLDDSNEGSPVPRHLTRVRRSGWGEDSKVKRTGPIVGFKDRLRLDSWISGIGNSYMSSSPGPPLGRPFHDRTSLVHTPGSGRYV